MKYVFLGDSQLCRLLKNIRIKAECINLAKSGASVNEALSILNKFIDDFPSKEDLKQYSIVILVGTNNCKQISSPLEFDRTSYKKITTVSRKFFRSVFLLKVPPIPKIFPAIQHISLVNKYINSFHSVENITIIDSFSPFIEGVFTIRRECFEERYSNGRPDLLHINLKGMQVIYRLLQQCRVPVDPTKLERKLLKKCAGKRYYH